MVEANQQYSDDEVEQTFIEKPDILDKFKGAGKITDLAIKKAIELCVPGADVYKVTAEVNNFVEEEVKKVFSNKKSKNMERGIAFPCTISVDNIMGHFSPLADESGIIEEGDVCKIVVGSHFDGYGANTAATHVAGDAKVTGRKADVVLAAYNAYLAAQRAIREATTNTSVTEAIAAVCKEFECEPVEGVLSHKLKRHLIDGNDCIINKETPTQRVEEFEFTAGDVFNLDVFVSTGEGKPKESELRCTVYKRELEVQYNLRMKSSRAFFTEVNKRFPTLPFSMASLEDSTAAKVGVKECVEHDLLVPYPVLCEKKGEFVAQFGCTIALQTKSTALLSGNIPFDTKRFESDKSVKNEETAKLIARDLWVREKQKKK